MSIYIFVHTITILCALIFGIIIFLSKKGTTHHKVLGWGFVVLMAASCLVSFWIQTNGKISPIHILSAITLYWLTMGVLASRYKRRFKKTGWLHTHATNMGSAFIGILIAGFGVIIRHFVDPGNTTLGFIGSGVIAVFLIPALIIYVRRVAPPRK